MYISDGGADMAVPPLKALFYIMAHGEYHAHDPHLTHANIRC